MPELKRGFGYWTVLCLSIGSILGTAIFFGASIGAQYSGNMTLIAWVLLSIIAIYIAMCFGELVSMFPKSGGVYEYSKQTYGRFVSFMTGWTAWLVGNISIVALVVSSVTILIPDEAAWTKIALSMAIILLLNLIALLGVEAASIAMIGFAAVIIAVITAIIGKGFLKLSLDNLNPLFTHPPLAMFITIFFLMETYFGWESATYLAEETKDPTKVIPRAIVHATITIAILGFFMMLVSLAYFKWTDLAELKSPTATLANQLFGNAGGKAVVIGIVIAFLGSAASSVITMPRLLMAMARDKLMLSQMQAVNQTFNTPHKAIIFQTIITIILIGMFSTNYHILLSILVPMATLMYIPVILTVTLQRHKNPDLERPFRAPFGKIGPVAVALFLIVAIIIATTNVAGGVALLQLSGSIILVGVVLYFMVALYYDPKMITDVNDLTSHLNLLMENINYPRSIRQEVLSFLGDLKGKRVLEFGCGVGTMTIRLLREVGRDGIVYASHFSGNDLKIAKTRVERLTWESEGQVYGQATFIHDPEFFFRVHPEVPRVDAVVSVAQLGYLQDIRKILAEMRNILPEGGRICLVEYSDFFKLLPSIEWLSSDEKIEQLFREQGFSVRVTRNKTFLWNRIFIYGFKYEGIAVI